MPAPEGWFHDTWATPDVDVSGMFYPVRCAHCRAVYDAGKVTACSVWTSPCCNRTVDDRGWKSRPDIIELDAQGREVQR